MLEQISSSTTSTGIDNPGVLKKKAKGQSDEIGFSEQLSQVAQASSLPQAPQAEILGNSKSQEKVKRLSLDSKQSPGEEIRADSGPLSKENEVSFSSDALKASALAQHPAMSQALSEAKAGTKNQLGPATSAEKSPTSMKSAVSMNTASNIAGPKPWSKDWVFRPGDEENPGLKPLFPGHEKPLTDVQAAQLKSELDELQNLESALKALGIQTQAIEGSEKNSAEPMRVQGGEAGKTAIQRDAQLGNTMLSQTPMSGVEIASGLGQKELNLESGLEKGAGSKNSRDPMAGAAAARRNGNPVGTASLSGDEFVQTLNGIRTGAVQGQSELSGEETGTRNSNLQGPKSPFNRLENGLKDKKNSFGDHGVTPAGVPPLWSQDRPSFSVQPSEVSGHVVKGAMSQDRLSSESLIGMSKGIRGLAPQGAGEIRVRLKPDHLGELNVRVTAHGNDVGLKIQASDEHAKKIIEESLSHLKDSLAEQNLTLARVDVTVGKAVTHTSHSDGQMDFSQSQQGGAQHGDLLGQNSNQGNRNPNSDWVGGNDVTAPIRMGAVKGQAQGAAAHGASLMGSRTYRDDGRLDITA